MFSSFVRRDERGEQRRIQLPDGEQNEGARDSQEDGSTHQTGQELQRDVVGLIRERDLVVHLAEHVAKAKTHDRYTDQHHQQPALDVHAEVEPLDETGAPQGFHSVANYTASLPTKTERLNRRGVSVGLVQLGTKQSLYFLWVGPAARLPHHWPHEGTQRALLARPVICDGRRVVSDSFLNRFDDHVVVLDRPQAAFGHDARGVRAGLEGGVKHFLRRGVGDLLRLQQVEQARKTRGRQLHLIVADIDAGVVELAREVGKLPVRHKLGVGSFVPAVDETNDRLIEIGARSCFRQQVGFVLREPVLRLESCPPRVRQLRQLCA